MTADAAKPAKAPPPAKGKGGKSIFNLIEPKPITIVASPMP